MGSTSATGRSGAGVAPTLNVQKNTSTPRIILDGDPQISLTNDAGRLMINNAPAQNLAVLGGFYGNGGLEDKWRYDLSNWGQGNIIYNFNGDGGIFIIPSTSNIDSGECQCCYDLCCPGNTGCCCSTDRFLMFVINPEELNFILLKSQFAFTNLNVAPFKGLTQLKMQQVFNKDLVISDLPALWHLEIEELHVTDTFVIRNLPKLEVIDFNYSMDIGNIYVNVDFSTLPLLRYFEMVDCDLSTSQVDEIFIGLGANAVVNNITNGYVDVSSSNYSVSNASQSARDALVDLGWTLNYNV